MSTQESKNNTDWGGTVKWIVFGVVALTSLFLFKDEIKRLLLRAESVEITKDGVKIKTTETLLGKAEISNVTTQVSNSQDAGTHNQYISRQHHFQISWPKGDGWLPNEAMGKLLWQQTGSLPTLDIPLFIMRSEPVGNFTPNVNVVVEDVGNTDISEYMQRSKAALEQQGWTVLTNDMDKETQGGFISFNNLDMGHAIYQFQRYAIAHGKAYVITASQLPPADSMSQNLKAELLEILNSFRIIK